MKKLVLFTALMTPLVLASGCSSTPDDYPNLAIRDIERVSTQMNPPVSKPWTAPQPGKDRLASISELTSRAQKAHDHFMDGAQKANQEISKASGAAIGSERWSVAQIALAHLETKRNDALIALADLDRIFVTASTDGESLGEIGPAQTRVEQLVTQENAIIAELSKKLK